MGDQVTSLDAVLPASDDIDDLRSAVESALSESGSADEIDAFLRDLHDAGYMIVVKPDEETRTTTRRKR
jgi:hypothetical protein